MQAKQNYKKASLTKEFSERKGASSGSFDDIEIWPDWMQWDNISGEFEGNIWCCANCHGGEASLSFLGGD
ncbi:MAG: hypothetical protein AAF226_16365 [Verrucomicrobiota bacterium]